MALLPHVVIYRRQLACRRSTDEADASRAVKAANHLKDLLDDRKAELMKSI